MPEPLSKIERRILNYLVDYLKENTYQPSIREIGKKFGIKSTKTVSEHLQSLADKGHIERDASRSRGVRIVGMNLYPDVVQVPCYAKVAAGRPALVRENVVSAFSLDRKMAGTADAFFLQVMGDSMQGMGILDGDMVLVEPAEADDILDGEVVAARIDGEAVVKRMFSQDGQTMLQSENSDYAPRLVTNGDDFALLGRVTGIFRHLTRAQTETVSV